MCCCFRCRRVAFSVLVIVGSRWETVLNNWLNRLARCCGALILSPSYNFLKTSSLWHYFLLVACCVADLEFLWLYDRVMLLLCLGLFPLVSRYGTTMKTSLVLDSLGRFSQVWSSMLMIASLALQIAMWYVHLVSCWTLRVRVPLMKLFPTPAARIRSHHFSNKFNIMK